MSTWWHEFKCSLCQLELFSCSPFQWYLIIASFLQTACVRHRPSSLSSLILIPYFITLLWWCALLIRHRRTEESRTRGYSCNVGWICGRNKHSRQNMVMLSPLLDSASFFPSNQKSSIFVATYLGLLKTLYFTFESNESRPLGFVLSEYILNFMGLSFCVERGRGLAVGERLWSHKSVRDPKDAMQRIWEHRCRYLK